MIESSVIALDATFHSVNRGREEQEERGRRLIERKLSRCDLPLSFVPLISVMFHTKRKVLPRDTGNWSECTDKSMDAPLALLPLLFAVSSLAARDRVHRDT